MEINNDKIIKVKDLSKQFGNFTAVNNITFDVKKGEIFGFLGANGAGKTTAIKMLIGLLAPSSGIAEVAGYDVYKESEKIKKSIGYMSQKFSLYEDLSIQENIEFYGGIYGMPSDILKEKAGQLIEKLKLNVSKKTLLSALPLGWKQKLAFSIAQIHDPKVIFLDEPTGGVDPITRRQFWEMIYEAANEGRTVFVTTHYMDEAEYCDRVSIMVSGRIEALDTPTRMKEHYKCKTMNDVFVKLARPANTEGSEK
jgi:ABC-2 type transport system ATP-binding protein